MAEHENKKMDIIETCVTRVLESALGPLYKKETRNSHKVTFSLQLETEIKDNSQKKMLENTAEKYACHLMGEIMKKADTPKDCELLQHYVDNLIQSVLKCSISTAINKELCYYDTVAQYADNLAEKICKNGIQQMNNVLRKNSQFQMISDFSDQMVTSVINSTIYECDGFIIKYSQNLVRDIMKDAKQIAGNHISACMQRESFSDDMATSILNLCFSEKVKNDQKEIHQYHCYAESLLGPLLSEVSNINKTKENQVSQLSSPQKQEQSLTNSNEQICQRNMLKLPLDNSKTASNAMHRKDSVDGQSEALTPRSVTEDNNWKRGLYHFADELLYSLSILEDEYSSHNIFGSLETPPGSVSYARVKRSGSCPIVRIPPTLYEGKSYRRQSETSVQLTGGVVGFADNLACNILRSTVLNYSCVH